MLESWHPNSRQIITIGRRDHFWKRSDRFLTISTKKGMVRSFYLTHMVKMGAFRWMGYGFCLPVKGNNLGEKAIEVLGLAKFGSIIYLNTRRKIVSPKSSIIRLVAEPQFGITMGRASIMLAGKVVLLISGFLI